MTRTERGVALVETALALPLIALLLFGVTELAMALSARQAISNMSRDSARYGASLSKLGADTIGSTSGYTSTHQNDDYDQVMLSKINNELLDDLPGTVTPTRIVVYRACREHTVLTTGTLDDRCVPEAGGSPSTSAARIIDNSTEANTSGAGALCTTNCMTFLWNNSTKKFDKQASYATDWSPYTQRACYDPTVSPVVLPEKMGVYVEARYNTVTGFVPFLNNKLIYTNTVVQLEPRDPGHCATNDA